jgi:2-dehydropantoate 2-reductase
MMRVALIGAGSLGIIIGALLTKCGKYVDIFDSSKDLIEALNKNGATITGWLELNVSVNAFRMEQMRDQYDIVFLLTKQTANHIVLPQILPYLHEKSIVCTLQNGIPEKEVASYVGRKRTIGGVVGFGATCIKPGISALTSAPEVLKNFAFQIGEIDGTVRPRLSQVKEYLDYIGKTEIITNLTGSRWTKILMTATFSGMSTALGCTYGSVLYDPKAMICAAHIADECIKVSHAQHIRLVEMQGEDMEFFKLKSAADIPGKMFLYKKIWGQHVRVKASMLQDLEKGRRSEIDYINGLVCKKGREYGVLTPFNDKIVELVHEAQNECSINVFDSLNRFDELIKQYAKDVAVIL